MALRSLCSLRLKTVVEYVVPCLERGLVDQSAYVRRNAIMGVLKLYHIEKDRVRESNLVTALQNLVLDEDALVNGAAFYVQYVLDAQEKFGAV